MLRLLDRVVFLLLGTSLLGIMVFYPAVTAYRLGRSDAVVVSVVGPVYELHGVRVVDGDTVHAELVDLPFGVSLRNRYIRLYNVWAPELGTAAGERAKAELESLLRGHARIYVRIEASQRRDVDKYGRLLGSLIVVTPDGTAVDVNSQMRRFLQANLTSDDDRPRMRPGSYGKATGD